MFCTTCGAEIPQGSRFCKKCGTPQGDHSIQKSPPAGRKIVDRSTPISPPDEQAGGSRFFWVGLIVVPLVVICALVTMVGAMKPGEKKVVQFTSPRLIDFSGTGPDSAKVGSRIEFSYEVTNAGTADFKDFRIAFPETIDKGFDVSISWPGARVVTEGGKKMFALGTVVTGQKVTIAVALTPKAEGEFEVKATFYEGTNVLSNERSDGMVYKKVKVSL